MTEIVVENANEASICDATVYSGVYRVETGSLGQEYVRIIRSRGSDRTILASSRSPFAPYTVYVDGDEYTQLNTGQSCTYHHFWAKMIDVLTSSWACITKLGDFWRRCLVKA